MLLQYGVPDGALDADGRTALQAAAEQGDNDLVEFFSTEAQIPMPPQAPEPD